MRDERHGERVKLIRYSTENASIDDNETVPPGTTGMIDSVDDAGTIHVQWDNGARLGLLPGQDQFEITDEAPIKMREYAFIKGLGGPYENDDDQHTTETATAWTLHLHLNVASDLPVVLERLSQVSGCGLTGEYSTGDSWEAWAEKPLDEGDHALHVYFRSTRALVTTRAMHLANHAYFSHGAGLAYAVSTAGDWAAQVDTAVV